MGASSDANIAAERRRKKRYSVNLVARVVQTDGAERGLCVVTDISETGARIKTNEALNLPDKFVLVLSSGRQLRRHCTVDWRNELELGVEFVIDHSSQKMRR